MSGIIYIYIICIELTYIYTYTHYASLLAALRADFPNFIMFDILNISKKIKCLLHFIIMSDCTLLRNYQIYLAFFRWMQDETRKSWGACEDHHCKSRTYTPTRSFRLEKTLIDTSCGFDWFCHDFWLKKCIPFLPQSNHNPIPTGGIYPMYPHYIPHVQTHTQISYWL